MTTDLGLAFSHGILDCRVPGVITGCFWFCGKNFPVTFDVAGRASHDLAGSRVFVRNPYPAPLAGPFLSAKSVGTRGYVTCSARVYWELPQPGMNVKWQLVNTAQFYWMSETDGPVEIEFPNPEVEYAIYSPSEVVPVGEDGRPLPDEVPDFYRDSTDAEVEEEEESEPEREASDDNRLDEFEWEALIRDADRASEKYSRLMEEYKEHPDRDRLVAREMGWVWLEKAADEIVQPESAPLLSQDDIIEPSPVKEREGIDWVRNAEGDIVHPLYQQAFELSLTLWKRCGIEGRTAMLDSQAAQDLMRHCQGFVGKLAGALNGLAYEPRPQSGFVLAYLKRALHAFNQTCSALDAIEKEAVLPVEYLDELRRGLMDVRAEITNMMATLRTGNSSE